MIRERWLGNNDSRVDVGEQRFASFDWEAMVEEVEPGSGHWGAITGDLLMINEWGFASKDITIWKHNVKPLDLTFYD